MIVSSTGQLSGSNQLFRLPLQRISFDQDQAPFNFLLLAKAQHCQKATLGERKRGSGYEILKGHHAFLLALCSCTSVCCPPHRIGQASYQCCQCSQAASGISCSSPLDFEIFEQVARQPQGQFTLVLFCTKIVGSSGCSSQSKKCYFIGFSPFN